jgi:alkylhydroperoxidase family enzyme
MAWIRKIEPGEARGLLKKEYEAATQRAGKVFEILKVQSLNPLTLHQSLGLYSAVMKDPSGLTRLEREFLATVVSQVNHCFY